MLPRNHRLKLTQERFLQLQQQGLKFRKHNLQLMVARTSAAKPTCFAVIVPKKLDKRATRRNRTRRLLQEAVRQLLPKLKPGYEVIIVAHKIWYQEQVKEVVLLLEELFAQASLLDK